VVIVGAMHQPDLEEQLARAPGVALVAASTFGLPSEDEARQRETVADLVAMAWATLFSAHARQDPPDASWVARLVQQLEGNVSDAELAVLRLRLEESRGSSGPDRAYEQWRRLADATSPTARPSWTGRVDAPRIDSDFDAFAGLTLRQRALHEASRAASAAGRAADAVTHRDRVAAELPDIARLQYLSYWEQFTSAR
jgi:hypothetical protein